jgi:hypothetical protein
MQSLVRCSEDHQHPSEDPALPSTPDHPVAISNDGIPQTGHRRLAPLRHPRLADRLFPSHNPKCDSTEPHLNLVYNISN